ncbi:MAG: hypothetical protein Q8R36_00785 [bacterium]|nr:hypothetical protein [bacterium]
MKAVFVLIVIVLVASGSYNYFIRDRLKHITVENDAVTIDVDDYVVRFLASGEFRETYMLFGGEYFKDKKLISPIILYGLKLIDAKDIYKRYPDFHRCKSPGAPLAQPKVKGLNLIPANKQVLDELRETIEEFEDNLANDGDRVCVSLVGKNLDMQSAEVPGKNIDIKDQLQPRTFYLINSSERINCKSLLDQ